MSEKNKIFDITPPLKYSKETAKEPQKILPKEPPKKLPEELPVKKPKVSEPADLGPKPVSAKGKLVPLFLGLALLAGGALSYFFIPSKVKIEIWPEQASAQETLTAIVSAAPGSGILGQIIEKEKTVSQDFQSTAKEVKSVKAQGVIRVYNNYSTAPQSLIAATRFISDDGKLFRTPIRVVVPGGTNEGGKLVPGFIDVQVVADQPGEDYNIDASAFSIPGFAGTPKYTAFYGKSFEPMKGGTSNEVAEVSQADLNKAKETLTQRVLAEAKDELKSYLTSNGFVLFDEAVSAQLAGFATEAKAGDDLENFSAQATASAKALVFKESDLKEFAINYIKSKLPAEEKLIDNLFKAEYVLESIDSAKPEISLKLSISANSYSVPEDLQIKEMVKSKSVESITEAIKNFPRIGKAKVDFWPFWVKSAPDNLERIEVILHF